MPSKLYPEDQAKVDEYLKAGINSVERKPFRMWTLLGVITVVLFFLGGLSLVLARLEGVI